MYTNMEEYSDKGFFLINDKHNKNLEFDTKLFISIINLIKDLKISKIVDLGCGTGNYVKGLMENGYEVDGYDGNPNTKLLTDGICNVIDLSEHINISKYDLTISLEVGEHIPKQYEQTFIDNLCCSNYLIISWAIENQIGLGHVNCRNNDYIIDQFEKRGYKYDINSSIFLRNNCSFSWFKNTLMVFKK